MTDKKEKQKVISADKQQICKFITQVLKLQFINFSKNITIL